jgi:hypothetical protein
MGSRRVQKASCFDILSRAGDRTRTGDVQLGKLAFYQLNYARSNEDNLPMKHGREKGA